MADPYARNLVNRGFYHAKPDIRTRVAAVLTGSLENRGLELIKPISRAFPAGTIIELIGTDERDAAPGGSVQRIAYLAFVELLDGGVILSGDEVTANGARIGTIAGFDDTHMPNHQNTIVRMQTRQSGAEIGLSPGDEILIHGIPQPR
jgi:hypothetical protein